MGLGREVGKAAGLFYRRGSGPGQAAFRQAFRAWAEVAKEQTWRVENETELILVIGQYQRQVLKGRRCPMTFRCDVSPVYCRRRLVIKVQDQRRMGRPWLWGRAASEGAVSRYDCHWQLWR
jgi:hypothetical protein